MTDQILKNTFQIQPAYALRDQWEALSSQEGLSYEILELSMPPFLNDRTAAASCLDWYRKSGRVKSVHGAFISIDPSDGDAELTQLSRKRCHESCVQAVSLGAENVVFHSSCAPFLRGSYLDSWADSCASFYGELANTYDLKILIENSQDLNPEPLRALMNRISHPRIGVCLDLGHVHYSHASLEAWLDQLGDRIGYLHLSDNLGCYDDHLPVGRGSIDWEKADALWGKMGKAVPVTLEMNSIEDARETISFLKKNGYFGYGRTDAV